jgi:hypothetical protein
MFVQISNPQRAEDDLRNLMRLEIRCVLKIHSASFDSSSEEMFLFNVPLVVSSLSAFAPSSILSSDVFRHLDDNHNHRHHRHIRLKTAVRIAAHHHHHTEAGGGGEENNGTT